MIDSDILMKGGTVFASMAALDLVWARYTYAMVHHRIFKSGVYAVLIIGLSGTTIIGYTSNHWLLIPAAFGAFGGTALATWYDKRKGKHQ